MGGAKGTRTPDLYNANVALFQLSYRPNRRSRLFGDDAYPLPLTAYVLELHRSGDQRK